MKCIFCLEVTTGSKEHIFPEAIGGKLTTNRVCIDCNSKLGSRVDSVLTDLPFIKLRREEIGITSKNRRLPQGLSFLAGPSTAIDKDGRPVKVKTSVDSLSRNLTHRVIPSITKSTRSDGNEELSITVDASEPGRIVEIIQGERRRAGLASLSDVQVQELMSTMVVTSEPIIVHAERNIKIGFIPHAFAKIAYELAFHWFGEVLLDDPLNQQLRQRIMSEEPDALDGFCHVGDADLGPTKLIWEPHKEHHIGFAFEVGGIIFIMLRIFDKLGAAVSVAQSPHLLNQSRNQNSFIILDARTGRLMEGPMRDELRRWAMLATERGRRSPMPDPMA